MPLAVLRTYLARLLKAHEGLLRRLLQPEHGVGSCALSLHLLVGVAGARSSQLLLLQQGLVGGQAGGRRAQVGGQVARSGAGVQYAQLGSQGIHLVRRRIHQQLDLCRCQPCKAFSNEPTEKQHTHRDCQGRAMQFQRVNHIEDRPGNCDGWQAIYDRIQTASSPARKLLRFCCCAACSCAWRCASALAAAILIAACKQCTYFVQATGKPDRAFDTIIHP